MVEVVYNEFLDDLFDDPHVRHVPGVRIDLALDAHVEFVIVPMIVWITACAEHSVVFFRTPVWIVETVRRIEVDSTGDGNSLHGG